MYEPPDFTTVPTSNDVASTEELIKQIEGSLVEGPMLAQLQTQLDVLKAWIAPVRRLSFDVLSHIFEICGEDSWKTPLRISGVSREWRTAVLSTPRAWAFLPVHHCEGREDLVNYFFQHSGNRPLHVFLNRSQHPALLAQVIDRLECLSVFDHSQIEEKFILSKLKHLSIRSRVGRIELLDIRVARFPALYELICESSTRNNTTFLSGSIDTTFPPLQVLSITLERNTPWIDLLRCCRGSLVSLKIYTIDYCSASGQEVVLPLLKCLEIRASMWLPTDWLTALRTPVLETYIEDGRCARSSPHGDLENVTRMCISGVPDLAKFPFLNILQLKEINVVGKVLSQLQDDRSLCTSLEIIETTKVEDLALHENTLAEVNRGRSQQILMRNIEARVNTLPHAIASLSPCGPDMPCSR